MADPKPLNDPKLPPNHPYNLVDLSSEVPVVLQMREILKRMVCGNTRRS